MPNDPLSVKGVTDRDLSTLSPQRAVSLNRSLLIYILCHR